MDTFLLIFFQFIQKEKVFTDFVASVFRFEGSRRYRTIFADFSANIDALESVSFYFE